MVFFFYAMISSWIQTKTCRCVASQLWDGNAETLLHITANLPWTAVSSISRRGCGWSLPLSPMLTTCETPITTSSLEDLYPFEHECFRIYHPEALVKGPCGGSAACARSQYDDGSDETKRHPPSSAPPSTFHPSQRRRMQWLLSTTRRCRLWN